MEKFEDLSNSLTSSNPPAGPEVEEISVSYLFQCLNCSVSVEMSSSWVNPNGDLLSVNVEFVKNPQIEELPLPYLILCSTCHQKLKKKKKSNSGALQGQGQAKKVVVHATAGDSDELNLFEIENIVEGEEIVCYLFQCLNCSVSVEMSSSWVNPNGDLLSVNVDFVKNPQIEELPLPFVILCSICHRKLKKKKKSNSDALQLQVQGQHHEVQDQAEKVVVDATAGDSNEDEDDEDELHLNLFEIENLVELIVKNMKNVDDLKNARLLNNTWNKYALKQLSSPSIQAKLRPIKIALNPWPGRQYEINLQETLDFLKNSSEKNRKIFQKFEFGYCIVPRTTDHVNYSHMFEIIEMTTPTEVTFMASDDDKIIDVSLFTQFLHKMSQHIVHLKLHIFLSYWRPELENLFICESLPFEFPKLKTLEIHGISSESSTFMTMLLNKCPFLDNLKLRGGGDRRGNTYSGDIDHNLPELLTPEITQKLHTLHLGETSFYGNFLERLDFSQMNLKSIKIYSTEILHVRSKDDRNTIDFRQLKLFLTSQSQSLVKLTIHFLFDTWSDSMDDSMDDIFEIFEDYLNEPLAIADQNVRFVLDIPLLENLKILKIKYDWHGSYGPVKAKPINLPEILPNLRKIVINYEFNWSFMTDKPTESVEELVLKTFWMGDMSMLDLVSIFPKIKYLKVKSDWKNGKGKVIFSSIEGWSSTLKMIEIQFKDLFPQDFNFQGISALSNLDQLYLHQKKRKKDQKEIRPDFTPLFNMKKLSKLVIKNIKISEDVIEELFEKFPKLDYTP